MAGTHKLLIFNACATVAEGRQGRHVVTARRNNNKQDKANVVSEGCEKMTLFDALDSTDGTQGALSGVNDCGFAKLGFCAATVVLLRHYIDDVASLII